MKPDARACLLALACATFSPSASSAEGMTANADARQTIQNWPTDARKAAK